MAAGNRQAGSQGLRVLTLAAYRLHLETTVFAESRLGVVCAHSLLHCQEVYCILVILSSGPVFR